MHLASTVSHELAALVVSLGRTRPARRLNYPLFAEKLKIFKCMYVSYVLTTKPLGGMYVPGV